VTARMTRRSLLAAVAGSSLAPRLPAQATSSGIKLGLGMLDLSDATLKFARQLGLEWLATPAQYLLDSHPRGLVPAAGGAPRGSGSPWTEAGIRRIKERVESFGLHLGLLPMGGLPHVILGTPERDRDIEHALESIRIAGRLAIPVLEYTFLAIRPSEGYYVVPGRGGSELRAFDYERIKQLPPLPEVGEVSAEEYWKRLTYFLKAVIPAAERAGVRLALHPNDPPVERFRGTGLPLRSLADLKRLIEVVPSPSNGITLDTGVAREMGENVVETIRYFGPRDRINHVHFRNVRLKTRYTAYTETFVDEGDNDMLALMRAFREVNYSHMLIPDHTPQLAVDSAEQWAGWAYAVGYIKALLKAAEAH
jgi:mannonate dehydratase